MTSSAFGPLVGHTDPTRAGGDFVGPGGPHERGGVLVDPTRAVLLDDVGVVLIEPVRDGQPGPVGIGLTLAGRINKTSERARVLYLMDTDGAAAVISELFALASRVGPEFAEDLMARVQALAAEGLTDAKGA